MGTIGRILSSIAFAGCLMAVAAARASDPPLGEACCLSTGSSCGLGTCFNLPEACCMPDGTCSDVGTVTCALTSGISQGFGSTCAEVVCPGSARACCMADGSCVDLTAEQCMEANGIPGGPGTNCETFDCITDLQACCLDDLTCIEIGRDQCLELRGVPQGQGSVCELVVCPALLDLGDAPALFSSDGARHVLGSGLALGSNVFPNIKGIPSANADGDDMDGFDDEEGVTFTGPLLMGQTGCVEVVSTAPGLLDAWIDFDGSGVWGDLPSEMIFSNTALVGGVNTGLCFAVPATTDLGPVFARFRLSTAGGLSPTGLADDGEVEDYRDIVMQAGPPSARSTLITRIERVGSSAHITWDAEDGVLYQPQFTDDVNGQPQVWTSLGPPVLGPANTRDDPGSNPQRAYRVVTPNVAP